MRVFSSQPCIEILIHLAPEDFAGLGVVGIVEGSTEAEPVVDVVGDGLTIHGTHVVELLVVVDGVVELRPYGDHEAAVHLVDAVDHSLGIGEA